MIDELGFLFTEMQRSKSMYQDAQGNRISFPNAKMPKRQSDGAMIAQEALPNQPNTEEIKKIKRKSKKSDEKLKGKPSRRRSSGTKLSN